MKYTPGYRTTKVNPALIDQVLSASFAVMEKKGADIRDVTRLEIRRAGHINKNTFRYNFRDIGGVHTAIAKDICRYLETSLPLKSVAGNAPDLGFFLKLFDSLVIKLRHIDYAILSADREFWPILLSAIEPQLREAWLGCSERAYIISLSLLGTVLAEAMTAWREKRYAVGYRLSCAQLLHRYVTAIGEMNMEMQDYLDVVSVFR